MQTPDLHPIGTLYTVDEVRDGARWRVTYKVIGHAPVNGVLTEQREAVSLVLLTVTTGPSERKQDA